MEPEALMKEGTPAPSDLLMGSRALMRPSSPGTFLFGDLHLFSSVKCLWTPPNPALPTNDCESFSVGNISSESTVSFSLP